jgi:transposase-like protein
MPLLHHDFRRFIDALDELNPAQIENAQTKIRDLRRKTEAISEIEARTNQEHECPFCGEGRRQKWGRTRTKIQRYRCCGCQKTYSGRTGSAIGRIHRPDLFMVVLWDMLSTSVPQSVRALAHQLRLNKYTVWRWRMLVFSSIGSGTAMGLLRDYRGGRNLPAGVAQRITGVGPALRRSAECRTASAAPLGRLHDKRTEDDARTFEVAAAHSHGCGPQRGTSLPQTAEPQGRNGGTSDEPLGPRRCSALLGRRQRLQEPRSGARP